MKKGFVDIHQHLLWGLDDGADDRETMRDMLKCAHEQGIRRIYATTHVCPGFRAFDAALYAERLAEAREICEQERLEIDVVQGAETAWTYQTPDALRQGRIPTMNGTEYVLIEFWPSVRWDEVETAVRQLLRAGFVPILAHVERYRCFFWSPARAARLKQEHTVYYQVNASSVLGGESALCNQSAKRLLKRRLVDAVASDAHNCGSRPQRMAAAYRRLKAKYGAEYARALTHFDEVIS